MPKALSGLCIAALLTANVVRAAEEMTGDELKSQQKSSVVFKSRDGVKASGLQLERKDMAWWEDAKFGLFIHWGLYAIPGRGEWTMNNEKIPAAEYAKLADEFKPKHFDAAEWARVAKAAGMKYMVLTARHHDGFALWDSPASYGDFDSMETAAHRDFVAEYTKACRDAGLRVGLYFSPMDWRFPGYFKPKELFENAALMKKQAYGQIEELMSKYGRIDVLWYDGGWLAHNGTDADAAWFWEPVKLNRLVRKHQPLAVINPRSGWEGDFQCDEGGHDIKGPIINDVPWEKCLNLNMASWGFNNWQNLMTRDDIIRMLVNVVGRGGNVLLNVGPDRDGVIPPAHVQRLKEVGLWLETHGEALYATRPGPFQPGDWGVSTHRDKTVYIHVLKWSGENLKLPALPAKVLRASIVTGGEVNVSQNENGIELSVPPTNRSELDTVIALELDRPASSLPLVEVRAAKSVTAPSPLNAPLQWTTGDAVVKPISDARGIVSVKDPSIVRYNDRWHIYATTAATNGAWGMVYLSFADWADAANAKPYYLDENPNLRGYHCAPQIFYFRPQKKWYLIYQSGQPQYSMADDLAKPETWTKPVDFFPTNPPSVSRSWLDFWIICDDTHAYLFCTGDNGRMYRSRTKLEDFPNRMSDPVVVIEGSRDGVFEGSMTYKIKGADAYLTLVEAIGPSSRYYRAWISDRLDGEWKPVPSATTFAQPFAGINNVRFEAGVTPWTKDISHGELIRDGYDETPTIDLKNLQLLFQGYDPAKNTASYSQLPYRLGLLRLNSATTNPPSAASPSTRAKLAASIRAPYELATWRGFRAAAVSYTFDDNSPKQFSVAQPMFDAKGLPATFFCIVGNPDWAAIENASSKGHEIGSHTLTHPDLTKITDAQVITEESGSKSLIESHTGKKCVSIAYPFCSVPPKSITSEYYPFARSCNESLVPSTPADFLSVGAMSCHMTQMNTAADNAASSGSWLVWLIHGIDDDPACCPITSAVLQSNLDQVAANTNKWWVETFGNVCRYIQERDASVLTVVSNGAASITLRLTNNLDNTIFNYPLTLRRPMPGGWQAAAITQNGASVPSQVVDGKLTFDVVPNSGDIVLSKLGRRGF